MSDEDYLYSTMARETAEYELKERIETAKSLLRDGLQYVQETLDTMDSDEDWPEAVEFKKRVREFLGE